MKRCLLIGGAGFIGQNLAIELKDSFDISIVDCVDSVDPIIADIPYYKRDFFSDGIEDALIGEMDYVILLACTVGPKTSMENPELCYKSDIVSLNRLLLQMNRLGSGRLVFISSGGTVYGEHEEKLLTEEMQNFPINHYGIMKLTQEKIILMYNSMYGMNNIIFRLANPYGCGQRLSSGIGAVTAILSNVLQEEKIHIWGDGSAVRDYIYITDAVTMMKRLLQHAEGQSFSNAVFNVGTGIGTSLNELILQVEAVTGMAAEVVYENARLEDVTSNILDNRKIVDVIGGYTCMTVQEGIKNYCRLYQKEKME